MKKEKKPMTAHMVEWTAVTIEQGDHASGVAAGIAAIGAGR